MFLSMLVAWMIPDVPRSLREQLKKENMMLMEFLLNQDQEARVKSHSPRPSIPCYHAIDIVVEAPLEEHEEQPVVEEEERVEINLDEPRRTSDSDPEIAKSIEEVEENGQERQGGEDEGGEVEGGEKEEDGEKEKDGEKENGGEKENDGEKEKDGEVNEESGKGDNEQEGGEEREEGGQIKEEEKEVEVKAVEEEICTVDLDSFMSELGLLGKRRKRVMSSFYFLFNLHNMFYHFFKK